MRYVILVVAMFLLWFSLSGHAEPLLLLLGLASSVWVGWTARRMDKADGHAFPLAVRWARLPGYLLWLLGQIVRANIQVARIILQPRLSISPVMIPIRTRIRSALCRTLYANSITLTPGTLTTGTKGDLLRVHALTWKVVDGREEDEMERRILALEQEDTSGGEERRCSP